MRTSQVWAWIVSGAVGLTLALPSSAVQAQGLTKVTIGYSSVGTSFVPLKIAEEAKLFEKHGLDANVVLIRGGGTMMKALLAGEVAAAVVGGTSVILARAAGGDVKMVLAHSNTLFYHIVAAPHLQGKITRIEDLRGKRVAISSRGAESETVMRLIFQKYNIAPQEVTFLQIGEGSERLAALTAKTADVTAMPSPLHLQAIRAGFPVVVDVAKERIEWFHTGVAMQESWMRQNPRVALALAKIVVEAAYYGWANKAFTKKVLAKFIKVDDDELLEKAYQDFLEYQAKDFRSNPAGILAAIQELAEANPKVRGLTPEEIVDLSLIEQLDRTGFLAEMKRRYTR